MYNKMFMDTVHIPLLGFINLGPYFMAYAAFVIVATSNAVNITDGLDGLVTGLTIIALTAFWYLSSHTNMGDIDLFITVIIGSLLAFLYFNIFPARVWLGDTGALALGAILAVISLFINQSFVLIIVGGVFVIETLSSFLQIFSKATRHGAKIFKAAPLHHHFEAIGWDETKVTMRFWLAGAVLAYLGLFIAIISR